MEFCITLYFVLQQIKPFIRIMSYIIWMIYIPFSTNDVQCFWKCFIIKCINCKICLSLGFYIATQFWFSACVLLTVFGLFYTTLYMYLNRSVERYVQILFTAGSLYITAGKILHLYCHYIIYLIKTCFSSHMWYYCFGNFWNTWR